MNLNLESDRLRTFDIWPLEVRLVDPQQWARNGFFAADEMVAECNWCHQRMNALDFDQVEEQHRILQPLCGFVLDFQGCGNVPLELYNGCNRQQVSVSTFSNSNIPTTSAGNAAANAASPSVDLLVEANRLATFKNWPNPNISPESLAKAGFFYLNRSDEVKCAWCKGVIAKWEKQDIAFEEHKRFFPDCPRVQLGPLIEMASDGIRDLGIQQISTPKKPKFSSLDTRLRTYANWPIGDIQQPEALAQAGLYYQNVDDQVRCFHCNIGLRSWQKEDDPWFEHAKWYPQCHFVRLVKGPNYIRHVQDTTRQVAQSSLPPVSCPAVSIEEAMSTPPVLQALEFGIDGGSIRNATQRQLNSTGRPYSAVEDLIKAIFSDRSDEEEPNEIEEIANIPGIEVEGSTSSLDVREVSRRINSMLNAIENSDYADQISISEIPAESNQCQRNVSSSPVQTHMTPGANLLQDTLTMKIISANEKKTQVHCRDTSPNRSLSLEEENRKLKDARLCKVCLDEEVGVVFLPCGHLVTCVQCAPGVNLCPMCRTAIKGFVRTYLS